MCGIYGAFWKKSPADSSERLESARRSLLHRGPDDHGLVAIQVSDHSDSAVCLGHTRLAILDLSAAGRQPMTSKCGRYTIVFNGEIYNYLELRSELATQGYGFDTETDTEILLAAWIKWGDACLKKLIGMFAFVVYDSDSNTLSCARDAFGIKPLFYSVDNGSFLFCSEVSGLLELRSSEEYVNYQRIHDYILNGLQDAPGSSFINNIQHLPPAHTLVVDLTSLDSINCRPWWSPNIRQRNELSFAQAAEHLRELFLYSIRLHLRSDVPVGIALSGGIDSSAIVCAARELEPTLPIHTFSYIAEDKDLSEQQWIEIVNKHVKAHSHIVRTDAGQLEADLQDLVQAQGEPFISTSIYAQYCIFRAARQSGFSVILEGQGADELLAGYQGYPGQRMRSLCEQLRIVSCMQFAWRYSREREMGFWECWKKLGGQLLPENLHSLIYRRSFSPGVTAMLSGAPLLAHCGARSTPDMGRRPAGYGRRVMEAMGWSITHDELPTLLRFGDRNAMRFSVENRVPFLTIDLAEFLLGLPEEFLISPEGQTKSIFRTAMRGIVPDAILDRKDKIGFSTPMAGWLNCARPAFEQAILNSPLGELLHCEAFFSEWDRAPERRSANSRFFWRLTNIAYWSKEFNKLSWSVA